MQWFWIESGRSLLRVRQLRTDPGSCITQVRHGRPWLGSGIGDGDSIPAWRNSNQGSAGKDALHLCVVYTRIRSQVFLNTFFSVSCFQLYKTVRIQSCCFAHSPYQRWGVYHIARRAFLLPVDKFRVLSCLSSLHSCFSLVIIFKFVVAEVVFRRRKHSILSLQQILLI
jgi:hypothetical protein